MNLFTTRIELHNSNGEDYKTLHQAMQGEGFSRTITDDKGVKYQLPTAEYNRLSALTTQQILDSAKRAAAKTKKTASILVTKSNGRQWDGLPVA